MSIQICPWYTHTQSDNREWTRWRLFAHSFIDHQPFAIESISRTHVRRTAIRLIKCRQSAWSSLSSSMDHFFGVKWMEKCQRQSVNTLFGKIHMRIHYYHSQVGARIWIGIIECLCVYSSLCPWLCVRHHKSVWSVICFVWRVYVLLDSMAKLWTEEDDVNGVSGPSVHSRHFQSNAHFNYETHAVLYDSLPARCCNT